MQREVLSGVEGLLERQRLALRAEEVAQLRAARARLAEVEAELARERGEREQERGAGGESLVSGGLRSLRCSRVAPSGFVT
jgi:hypothetical protein